MLFFTNDGIRNLVVTLSELETAALLVGSPGSALHPDAPRWYDFADAVSTVIADGGILHLVLEGRFPDAPCAADAAAPLSGAGNGLREAVLAALEPFAKTAGRAPDPDRIMYVP